MPDIFAAGPPGMGLQIEQLVFSRGAQAIVSIDAFAMARGTHALVTGPSGCGKTTLLGLIAGLLPIQQGRIKLAGEDLATVAARGPQAMDRFRARMIGLVSQQPMLFGMLGALDNLLIARQLAGFEPDRAACLDLLSQLGLDRLAARRPRELSRGQQQRVALARALVNRPALILADEPTANLDDEHATQVVRLLQDRALALNATLLIATHDARVRDHFDRVLALPAQPRP